MSIISITESANDHLSNIVRDNKVAGVSLGIKGGGCAGFSYEWELLETIPDEFNTEDKLDLKEGQLCIQPEAVMFILDSILVYSKTWNVELKDDYVWQDVFKLIKNYKKFLSFDKTKFKFIIRELIGIE